MSRCPQIQGNLPEKDVTALMVCFPFQYHDGLLSNTSIYSFMFTYDNDTLEPIALSLQARQKLHIVINHDEMSLAVNEQHHRLWLAEGQQPLRKKGNGHSIHVSDFIL